MAITRTRTVYVSPKDDVQAAILAAIRAATASVHISAYGLTLEPLADLLIAHHQAGRTVGVVSDHTQAAGPAQHALLRRLVDAGVDVVIATAPGGAINHSKLILIDLALGATASESVAIYGSYNFSLSAARQENQASVDNDPALCQMFYDQYQEARAVGLAHPEWQLQPATPPAGGQTT